MGRAVQCTDETETSEPKSTPRAPAASSSKKTFPGRGHRLDAGAEEEPGTSSFTSTGSASSSSSSRAKNSRQNSSSRGMSPKKTIDKNANRSGQSAQSGTGKGRGGRKPRVQNWDRQALGVFAGAVKDFMMQNVTEAKNCARRSSGKKGKGRKLGSV